MKYIYIALISAFFIINACSSKETKEVVTTEIQEIGIDYFSNKYSYRNDTISLLGSNFPIDKSKVNIYFDSELGEILSITSSKLHIKTPESITNIPEIKIEIEDSEISYSDSFEPIVILDNTKEQWIEIPNNFDKIESVYGFYGLNKEQILFSINSENEDLSTVRNSLNGGITIDQSLYPGFVYLGEVGGYFLGRDQNVYWYQSTNIVRVEKNGEKTSLSNNNNFDDGIIGGYADNGENIIIGTKVGDIYESSDSGGTFIKTHENIPSKLQFTNAFGLSTEKIWLGGNIFPVADGALLDFIPAKLLYKNSNNQWSNNIIEVLNDDGSRNVQGILNIHFSNENVGFAIVRTAKNSFVQHHIIKSENGGESWNTIYTQESLIENFSFKNENEGWFISENYIYKTTDGGLNWTTEYTNDTNCKGILYNEGIIWVIAEGKTLKYYE